MKTKKRDPGHSAGTTELIKAEVMSQRLGGWGGGGGGGYDLHITDPSSIPRDVCHI